MSDWKEVIRSSAEVSGREFEMQRRQAEHAASDFEAVNLERQRQQEVNHRLRIPIVEMMNEEAKQAVAILMETGAIPSITVEQSYSAIFKKAKENGILPSSLKERWAFLAAEKHRPHRVSGQRWLVRQYGTREVGGGINQSKDGGSDYLGTTVHDWIGIDMHGICKFVSDDSDKIYYGEVRHRFVGYLTESDTALMAALVPDDEVPPNELPALDRWRADLVRVLS